MTLDRVGTTSALAGTNHLDLAVSDTPDPTKTWTIYSLPVQNNGTTDGSTIWLASEYIAQTCTYADYLLDPTCGHTRKALANWATRITQVHF